MMVLANLKFQRRVIKTFSFNQIGLKNCYDGSRFDDICYVATMPVIPKHLQKCQLGNI